MLGCACTITSFLPTLLAQLMPNTTATHAIKTHGSESRDQGGSTSRRTHVSIFYIRPGKVDSLFPISHFLTFDASRRSIFIIHYDVTIYLIFYIEIYLIFYYKHKINTGNHKPVTNVAFKANSSDPARSFS